MLSILGLIFLICSSAISLAGDHWPQWRGPLNTGVAPDADPPVHWDENRNIRWKLPIPGRGLSTPIIWGETVYITTAVPHGEKVDHRKHDHDHDHGAHDNMDPTYRHHFVVMAVDRNDGKVLWEKAVRDEVPHEPTHVTGSWASNTGVADASGFYAYFGSRGLFALDHGGRLLWEKDLGDMKTRHAHGEGSSPALHGDTLVINWDHQGASFLTALDKKDGSVKWRVERNEITSWSTPLIVEHEGRPQVIVAATGRVRGYDLADGRVIWECSGLSRNVVATPVSSDGMVYVANSYDFQAMLAIRLDKAKGDISRSEAVVWRKSRHTPYVPSPLLYDGQLYFLRHNQGIISNLEAKTGATLFGPVRVPDLGQVFASPVGAANRIYIVDRSGMTVVIERGPEFRVLARNQLNDSFAASPAVADRALFLRGDRYLYCIEENSSPK
ncbi:MAG: PQQ-binding-like beta-propeller repeat protein [Acidobacteriota bacterium]|nr:PQQ-binding-like beta-propeller repeat protein [Acidobacteriota bacterium]